MALLTAWLAAPCSLQAQLTYVADALTNSLYLLASDGTPTTIASTLNYPMGMALNSSGDIFIANNGSGNKGAGAAANTITEITPKGVISTFSSSSLLSSPADVALGSNGDLYVRNTGPSSTTNTITQITPAGVATTFVSGLSTYSNNSPNGMVFDSAGNMYVGSGSTGQNILKISPTGTKTTFATGLNDVGQIVFDSSGNLFVANSGANNVIKITPTGTTSVYATIPATFVPSGISFDTKGDLLVGTYGPASKAFVGNLYEIPVGTTNVVEIGTGLPYDMMSFPIQPVPEPGGALLFGVLGTVVMFKKTRIRRHST